MYVLILIFGAVGGEPGAALALDPQTSTPKRHATLAACQSAAGKYRATAANKVDPDTGIKAITSYSCLKVN